MLASPSPPGNAEVRQKILWFSVGVPDPPLGPKGECLDLSSTLVGGGGLTPPSQNHRSLDNPPGLVPAGSWAKKCFAGPFGAFGAIGALAEGPETFGRMPYPPVGSGALECLPRQVPPTRGGVSFAREVSG